MKKIQNFFIFLLLLFNVVSFGAQIPQAGLPAGFPQVSEEEMKKMEAEMAAFQKEIESLTPEEREGFFKSMEEAVQKIDELSKTDEGKALLDKLEKNDLTEAELDQLISQIVGEEPEPETVSIEKPIEKPQKVAPPAIITTVQEQAIDVINSIITHTNAFMIKLATMPEWPGKIKKWQKGKLINWPAGVTWDKLKAEIEQLVEKLNVILEKDQKTKEYYHIDTLIKDEALYNSLKKIQAVIAQNEPQVEEFSPLQKKLTRHSKLAIQKLIHQYIEAIYILTIPAEIKKLLAKFETRAQSFREEEEKALKKAELEGKRKLVPGAPIVAGTPLREYTPLPARQPEFSERMRGPAYTPSSKQPSRFERPLDQKKMPSADRKKPEAPPSKTKTKGGKDESKEDDPFTILKKKAEIVDKKVMQEADRVLERVRDAIANIAKSIKEASFFTDIKKHITDNSDVNFEITTEVLPDIDRDFSIRRGAFGAIREMHGKLKTPVMRKQYKEKLKKLYDEFKKPIEMVQKQLDDIKKDWDKLASEMPPFKHYAYFGQPDEVDKEKEQALEEDSSQEVPKKPIDEKLAEVQRKIPTPISLFELNENINRLKEQINTFDRPKL